MAKIAGNKLIEQSGNRKPRVHIKYETFTNGARKVVSLPFVMGVMSDLSGKSKVEKVRLTDRKFIDFDASSLDAKLKAIRPRVSMQVDNKLTKDGGQLNVDVEFESMDDFSPEGIAKKVEPLKKLLEAREKLGNLLNQLDGKSTEELEAVLSNKEVMAALAALPGGKPESN